MSGSEFGPARCRPGSRKRRSFARIALHSELVVGRLGPRQELPDPLSGSPCSELARVAMGPFARPPYRPLREVQAQMRRVLPAGDARAPHG
jgi:hypothetical protein